MRRWLGILIMMTSVAIPLTSSQLVKGAMDSYSIPLPFPPAFPRVLFDAYLSYNGTRGNGVAGYRWDIEGLSQISRCGISPVLSLQYCLDGERLLAVNGTYGSANSVYKTAAPGIYRQVVARGSHGSHPVSFEAETTGNKVITFGQNVDSRVIGGKQPAVHTWLLDSVKDNQGKEVMLKYDGKSSYKYLKRISHQNIEVEFSYADRKDKMTRYFDGTILNTIDKVLKNVSSFISQQRCGEIRLDHFAAGSMSVSLVTSMTFCRAEYDCFRSLTFSYRDYEDRVESNAMLKPSLWSSHYGYNTEGWRASHLRLLVDVNGDRMKDIIAFGNSYVLASMNTNSSSLGFVGYERISAEFILNYGWKVDEHDRHVIDVTGDGLPDIVGFGISVFVGVNSDQRGTKASFPDTVWSSDFPSQSFNKNRPKFLKDVNNDGLPDIFCYSVSSVLLAINTGKAFAKPKAVSTQMTYNDGWRIEKHLRFIEDVNNDGLPDMVGFGDDGVYVSLNKDGLNFEVTAKKWSLEFGYSAAAGGWALARGDARYLSDVNGDGLLDIVGFSNTGVMVALNTGTSFTTQEKWNAGFGAGSGWKPEYQRDLRDMNGDGLPDIVGFGCCSVLVALNTGHSFSKSSVWSNEYGYSNGWGSLDFPKFVDDVTGDGVAELVGFARDGVLVAVNKNRPISMIAVEGSVQLGEFDCSRRTTPILNTTVATVDMGGSKGISEQTFGGVTGFLVCVILALTGVAAVLAVRMRRLNSSKGPAVGQTGSEVSHVNTAFSGLDPEAGHDGGDVNHMYATAAPQPADSKEPSYIDLKNEEPEYVNFR